MLMIDSKLIFVSWVSESSWLGGPTFYLVDLVVEPADTF